MKGPPDRPATQGPVGTPGGARRDGGPAASDPGPAPRRLAEALRPWVPAGARVGWLGPVDPALLAALAPSGGVVLDPEPARAARARERLPHLSVDAAPPDVARLPDGLDAVVVSDLLHEARDAWALLDALRSRLAPGARLIVTWPAPRAAAARALAAGASAGRAAFGRADVERLLQVTGFQVLAAPSGGPFDRARRIVAAPDGTPGRRPEEVTCTVVVPCKNERGNIDALFERMPPLGRHTELLLVDGRSDDGTADAIARWLAARPGARLLHQGDGVGKADAVRRGFAEASGDVLMILDADLTVAPEELPRFLEAWCRRGGLVSGSRLLYPMEAGAMRPLNRLGNRFFARVVGHLAGQRVTDALCGTKVIGRADYEALAAARPAGEDDPFGDFDLLLGAARLGLPITEVPVRYRARRWGETKIHRFRHGWQLLRLVGAAARRRP